MKRIITASLIFPLVLGAVACSDRSALAPDSADNNTGSPPPMGMVVSNPQSSSTNAGAAVGPASSNVSGESIVYVSLAPKTLPDALNVQIRNQTTGGAARLVPVIDGGFDPVPIEAHAGDDLNLTVSLLGGGTIRLTVKVPARRPPAVVRSNPPTGRIDVALNVFVAVIFSEPIDPKTLNATSVRLLRDGNPVSGTFRLSEDGWTAEFVPDRPLEPVTSYALVVTQNIQDRDGDALEASYSSTFTTVPSACPAYADPSHCPPFPTGGISIVTGVVTERTPEGSRPVANAEVWAYVQTPTHGYSRGRVLSDANGNFRIDQLPNASILLHAGKAGYDQPCGSVTELSASSATADIELVSQSHPILEAATTPPLISGVVYELTPNGRQPVAGARIWFETMMDLVTATTTTDENGRYAICRLPSFWAQQTVYASKDGYLLSENTVSVSGSMQLDIQMKR